MKFTILATTAAMATGLSMEQDPDFGTFSKFMQTYNRRYATQSETMGRFQIFKDNLKLIKQRNAKGNEKHGINQFTDIHPDEFRAQYHGAHLSGRDLSANMKNFSSAELEAAVPTAIDWRAKGAVTPVKNQGQCGSCWAFSTTEQLESDTFLATGTLPVLAPQQIVSCDTVDAGCNGGNPLNAYAYVQSAGGVEYSRDYAYTSGTTQTSGVCKFNSKDVAPNTSPTGYAVISQKPSQEKQMYAQILKSPMSVCVDATLWQTYQSGIITKSSNCGTSIDHAVQAVGIGTSVADDGKSTDYWIVRNSWTESWGEKGYVFVEVDGNVCGITAEATITTPQ